MLYFTVPNILLGIVVGNRSIHVRHSIIISYTETYSSLYSNFFNNTYIPECTENLIFIYLEIVMIVIILLWGGKLAWAVRHASSEFNESTSLATTVAVLCNILYYSK